MTEKDVIEKIKQFAINYGIDPKLLYAFCKIESNLNHMAIRYEPQWQYVTSASLYSRDSKYSYDTERILQSCSIGIAQVMGTVARELGLNGNLLQLIDLDCGLKYGCLKITQLKGKYKNLDDVIASYNAGSPIKTNGRYYNQDYVKKVRNVYETCQI